MLTPWAVNSLIRKDYKSAFLAIVIMFAPYLSKVFGLRKLVNKRTLIRGEKDAKPGDNNLPEFVMLNLRKDLCSVCRQRAERKIHLKRTESASRKSFVAA